jgi:uncharacterized protein (DUF1778 family)
MPTGKKKDEIVALNLCIPRSKGDEIKAAADRRGQKIVRFMMDAVDMSDEEVEPCREPRQC